MRRHIDTRHTRVEDLSHHVDRSLVSSVLISLHNTNISYCVNHDSDEAAPQQLTSEAWVHICGSEAQVRWQDNAHLSKPPASSQCSCLCHSYQLQREIPLDILVVRACKNTYVS